MKTLIQNAYVVTVDEQDSAYPSGAVLIDGERIAFVGESGAPELSDVVPDEIIDAQGDLLIPGIVNAHTHNAYYLMRGLGMDRDLKDWLMEAIWPGLMKIEPEDAYIGALAGCLENIRSGVTCLIDNYYAPSYKPRNIDSLIKGIIDSGIRAGVARGYHDISYNIPKDFLEDTETIVQEYTRLIDTYHGAAGNRIQIFVSPVNLVYATEDSVKRVWEVAKSNYVGMHTHVAEAQFEVQAIKERYGKPFIHAFLDMGVMGEKFHAVHAVHLSSSEIEILKDHGATAILNPASNLLLASGIAPADEMLKAGLHVALGTDAPNNNQDMLESMKYATILPRVRTFNPTAVSSYQALKMATIEGARCIGLDREIGSVSVGKKADLALVHMKALHNVPLHDPVANLVYASNQSDVKTVFIGGRKVLEDGRFTGFSEEKVAEELNRAGLALAKRLKS